jgi:outer membrane immunogenic protein
LLIALSLVGLLAGEAAAADLAMKAPEPLEVMTWFGFYLGAEGGWGRATGSQDQAASNSGFIGPPSSGDFSQDGWIAGGTVGYTWQPGRFVVGLEVDISAASIDGGVGTPICVPIVCKTKINWLHTGRVRLGVPFGQVMPYIVSLFRLGVNYHLGDDGPVMACY